jgi:hypothetical protein
MQENKMTDKALLSLNPKDVRLGTLIEHRATQVEFCVVQIRDALKNENPVKVITVRDLVTGNEVEVESMRKLIRQFVWRPGRRLKPSPI